MIILYFSMISSFGGIIAVALLYFIVFELNKKLSTEEKFLVKNIVNILLLFVIFILMAINLGMDLATIGFIGILSLLPIMGVWLFVRYIRKQYNQNILYKDLILTCILDTFLTSGFGVAINFIIFPAVFYSDNPAVGYFFLIYILASLFVAGIGGMFSSFYYIKKYVLDS